ncbi:MAG: glycosyltransferase family 4 protein [Alphaproteobacteria bacterium]
MYTSDLVKATVSFIDIVLFATLFPLVLLICYVRATYLRSALDRSQNGKILFLASGKFIKHQGSEDFAFKKLWDVSFQRQLILPGFNKCYIFYEDEAHKEIYKLTNNIIGIVYSFGKQKKIFRKTFSLYRMLIWFYVMHNFLKKISPEIIYTNIPGDNLVVSSLLSIFYKIPLVAQAMGSYDLASFSEDELAADSLKSFLYRSLSKLIFSFFFRCCSLVLAFNEYCASFAIHNGAHPAKVRNTRILPHFSDIKDLVEVLQVSKDEIQYPQKTKKNVIIWSRLATEKKLLYAIVGAIKALEIDEDLGLIIVGDGPLRRKIENLIVSSEVKDRVYLLGHMQVNSLMSYVYFSDIALIPLGGYAMLEACVLKKPIVCFDIEWHHELLTDEYSGYFADYPSTHQICEKILEAAINPEEAKKRGERAHEKFKILFNEERIREKESKIINNFRKTYANKSSHGVNI